jgi:hypothetical protein
VTPKRGALPGKTRTALRERSADECEICGRPGNNAHHRKNRSQGGTHDLSNLLLLCGSGTTGCHGWVTEHPGMSKLKGWTVWRSDDPLKVPVLYRNTWVRLDNGGNVTVLEGKRNALGHLHTERDWGDIGC